VTVVTVVLVVASTFWTRSVNARAPLPYANVCSF